MRHSLFALFRGSDGRSLARALVALLLLNLFVAGFQSGAMASGSGAVICSVVTPTDIPADAPASAHSATCCEMGCAPLAPALSAAPPVTAVPLRTATRTAFTAPAQVLPPALAPGTNRARGPPSLV